ncbi:hypothetical protein MtrunA17_Chr1g0150051 [Medicago truncatula]|uniref:Uncharacterized protein n=1 Tax=Medicago truncatula TaxID=3880 RepID=A0A396JI82_MEDTR|nr:hypothetical protein MtrunA17_Chr1g0150051 [Medicago truncatula]
MNVGFRLFVNIVSHSIGSVRIDNNGFLLFVFVIVVVESCCVDMSCCGNGSWRWKVWFDLNS